MGFFFDNPKEEKKEEPKQQAPSQGFFAAAGLMLLGVLLAIVTKIASLIIELLGLLAKQAIVILDPRDTENKTVRAVKISIIIILTCGPLIYIYRIPSVRDALTLSSTHTINVQKSEHIPFPDRSYFVPEGERRVFLLQQGGDRKYVNYIGHKKNFLKMEEGFCHLVTRSERVSLASAELPLYAVGFSGNVKYTVKESIGGLPYWQYILEKIKNPEYLFQKKEDLQVAFITVEKEGTWNELIADFEKIPSISGNIKPYELKALYFEHAMVCY
jgi:hypothetical protein